MRIFVTANAVDKNADRSCERIGTKQKQQQGKE
jgi:hypothetical protein